MKLLLAILLAGGVHEGGHYWAARFFDKRLQFRFAWGRFGVPRFVWEMPHFFPTEMWKAKVIAAAGFGAELFAAVVSIPLRKFKKCGRGRGAPRGVPVVRGGDK